MSLEQLTNLLRLVSPRGSKRLRENKQRSRRGEANQRRPVLEVLEDRTLLTTPVPGGTPNYFGPEPNWAYSPAPIINVDGTITGGIQKFVDSLPGLGVANANQLGQYIPVAVADTTTYPGSDYYEIGLIQYTQRMNSSLNLTSLRGYVQIETPVNASVSHHYALTYPDGSPIRNQASQQVYSVDPPQYLGPIIVAQRDRAVRVKFTNFLPTGSGGDLFLPVDTTVMGAGAGPNMAMMITSAIPVPGSGAPNTGIAANMVEITATGFTNTVQAGTLVTLSGFTPSAYNGTFRILDTVPAGATGTFRVILNTDPGMAAVLTGREMVSEAYTSNRATLHLHGGLTPWISDGTPHQWITPAGENTNYPEGVSVQNVPDMPDPGDGSETFYYTNQQSARLMFYHDHSYGITRLNVYAGEAAGYILQDPVEQDLVNRGILPATQIPLIIQDKTFIDPSTVLTTDPTWPIALDPNHNDLWTPHVYMPNQDPNNLDTNSGVNPFGRWDYGPWFHPAWIVNNKPFFRLDGIQLTNPGAGYLLPPTVTITRGPNDTTGVGAQAHAELDNASGRLLRIVLDSPGSDYTNDPIITISAPDFPTGTLATAEALTTQIPNIPNISETMEAFQDTPLVNGTAYPFIDVQPQAYRFRVLNAADDRSFNLQLYVATSIISSITLDNPGSNYDPDNPPFVSITNAPGDTTGHGAVAMAMVDPDTGELTGIVMESVGSGYTLQPIVTIIPSTLDPNGGGALAHANIYTGNTEVGMVPAALGAAAFPTAWTQRTNARFDVLDGRNGGVPDPANSGPSMIQVGTEGGFLPAPVVLTNTPVGFEQDPKTITVLNVKEKTLYLGPAERADLVIDFSKYAGKTLILYNDAPAATPAMDPRLDYFTSDLDHTSSGGTVPTLPGYGPNTRTILQIRVANAAPAAPYNLAALQQEFTTTETNGVYHPGVFARDQDPILVPQAAYNSAYDGHFPADRTAYVQSANTNSLTFHPLAVPPYTPNAPENKLSSASVTLGFGEKTIQELFENDYGRMNATLGIELGPNNNITQTTIPHGYSVPPTEVIDDSTFITPVTLGDGTQLWRITHNGVDTHAIHFHLFNVQVVNRIDWAGNVKPPDPNELGWKETVRMNPLENIIVALRPVAPRLPFGVPNSDRLIEPTMPQGALMNIIDPVTTANVLIPNETFSWYRDVNPSTPGFQPWYLDFKHDDVGWEYVWHCHILSHEEMDMMRPMIFHTATVVPDAPVAPTYARGSSRIYLHWTDLTPATGPRTMGNPKNEVGFRIERLIGGVWTPIGNALANASEFIDNFSVPAGTPYDPAASYSYRVIASDASGDSAPSQTLTVPPGQTLPTTTITFPANNGSYNAASWTGTISGTATDGTGANISDGFGIAKVWYSVQEVSTQKYLNSNNVFFSSFPEIFFEAVVSVSPIGKATWTASLPYGVFHTSGYYVIDAYAMDKAGNYTNPPTPPLFTGLAVSQFWVSVVNQRISFGPVVSPLLGVKHTYGDADFGITATADSGLPVNFTATGPVTVNQVNGAWTVHITGAGNATITAHQPGNAVYNPAVDLTYNVTIFQAPLTVRADPQSKVVGTADPTLTWQITSGRLFGSDRLTGNLTRRPGETAGTYPISVGTLSASPNYSMTFVGNNFTIIARPYRFVATSPTTPQTAPVMTNFLNNLVVTVYADAANHPLPNARVTFTGPASGAGVTFPNGNSVLTDANGRASVPIKANSVAGSYRVSATVVGLSGQVSFPLLTNTAGLPVSVAFLQMPTSVTVGVTWRTPVQVIVRDAYNNPISGATVTLSVTGGSATLLGTVTLTTDSTGRALFTNLRLNSLGQFTLTATARKSNASATVISGPFTVSRDSGRRVQ